MNSTTTTTPSRLPDQNEPAKEPQEERHGEQQDKVVRILADDDDDDNNNNNNTNNDDEERADTGQRPPATAVDEAKTTKRRRQKQLSTTSLNWGIPANHQATLHAQNEKGDESWQFQLLKRLHGRRMQILLAALLLLDVFILFCELALLTLYPSCHLVERDAISCCPVMEDDSNIDTDVNAHHERWLASAQEEESSTTHDNHHYSCAAGLSAMPSYEATCDAHKWERVHHAETALVSFTLTILTVFFIELTLTMIALHPAIFFRQVFYALDYFIVTVSLVLEITFYTLGDEILASLIGLVILGRIWRFVRIGHGILELAEDMAHERENELLVYAEELETLLTLHKVPLPEGEIKPHSEHNGSDLLERLAKRQRDKRRMQYHQRSHDSSS
eukprot:scaffold2820_cov160-Amphora_coffeaeformis.AAC.5